MPTTRTSLLLRLRSNADPTGWQEFVEVYEPLLRSAVRRAGIREHDVPDVVQDVLVRLLRALPAFDYSPERGRFRSWLYAVCRTTIIDWRRKEPPACRPLPNGDDAPVARLDCSQWDIEHRCYVLRHAMSFMKKQVTRGAWNCFESYVIRERDVASVAADLRVTPAYVYVVTSRIRTKLELKCQQFDEDLA